MRKPGVGFRSVGHHRRQNRSSQRSGHSRLRSVVLSGRLSCTAASRRLSDANGACSRRKSPDAYKCNHVTPCGRVLTQPRPRLCENARSSRQWATKESSLRPWRIFTCANGVLFESILRSADPQNGFHTAKTHSGHCKLGWRRI
jgi:hypothetical protein